MSIFQLSVSIAEFHKIVQHRLQQSSFINSTDAVRFRSWCRRNWSLLMLRLLAVPVSNTQKKLKLELVALLKVVA